MPSFVQRLVLPHGSVGSLPLPLPLPLPRHGASHHPRPLPRPLPRHRPLRSPFPVEDLNAFHELPGFLPQSCEWKAIRPFRQQSVQFHSSKSFVVADFDNKHYRNQPQQNSCWNRMRLIVVL